MGCWILDQYLHLQAESQALFYNTLFPSHLRLYRIASKYLHILWLVEIDFNDKPGGGGFLLIIIANKLEFANDHWILYGEGHQ